MDYTSLVGTKAIPGSIALWVNATDLDTLTILTEAQALIYQTLRVREMIVSDAAIAVAAGDASEPLPSGFLDPINMRDIYLARMKLKDLSSVKARRGYTSGTTTLIQGLPRWFALTGTTVEFDCAADASAAGTYLMDYFGTPAALSAINPTNFLTVRYPTLLRKACLWAAADFKKDRQGVQQYSAEVLALAQNIMGNDDLAFRGGEYTADYTESRI
jgi:hypothetical protein